MIRILLKILLWVIALILLIIVIFHLPPVQNRLAGIAERVINKQLNAPASLGKLYISLLRGITIEDLLLVDLEQDTILAVDKASVDVRYGALLQKEIYIEEFQVEGILARLVKESDSTMNIAGIVKETPEEPEKDTAASDGFGIGIGSLEISEVDVRYLDRVAGSEISVDLNRLAMQFEQLDLEEQELFLESTVIAGLQVVQFQPGTGETAAPADDPGSAPAAADGPGSSPASATSAGDPAAPDSVLFDIPWDVQFAEINLEDIGLVILSGGSRESPDQSFTISGLNARFSGLRLAGSMFTTSIDSFRAQVGDFPIDQVQVHLLLDENYLSVDSLRARSAGNQLFLDAGLSYPSFAMIQSAPDAVSVRLDLRAESPAGGLAPYLPASMPVQDHPPIYISGRVDGTLDLLRVERMLLVAGEALKAGIRGSAQNVTGEGALAMEISLDSLVLQTPALLAYLPDTMVPSTINLPQMIRLQGEFSSRPSLTAADFKMTTSLGDLAASGRLSSVGSQAQNGAGSQAQSFSADINTPGLDVGTILGMQDTLGTIAFKASAQGYTGGREPQLDALLDIGTLELMGYTYDSIYLEAGTGEGGYSALVRVVDPNLDFRLTGIGRSISTDPRVDLEVTLAQASLEPLNLAGEPTSLEFHGDIGIWIDIPGSGSGQPIQRTAAEGAGGSGSFDPGSTGSEGSESFDPGSTGSEGSGSFLPQALQEYPLLDILEGEVLLDGIRYRSAEQSFGVDTVRLALEQFKDSLRGVLLVKDLTRNDTLVAEMASIRARGKEKHIRLDYLAKIAGGQDDILAGPSINGEGELFLPGDSLVFTSAITIHDSMAIPDSSNYRLRFASRTPSADSRQLDALLSGERVGLSATAMLKEQGEAQMIDARVHIDSLDLGLVSPLAGGIVDTIGGNITGSLSASGRMDAPDLQGDFLFNQVYITPSMLNTGFLLEQEKVGFNNSRVMFDSVAITDERGNVALLEGWIDLASEAYPAMDLSLKAEDFRLMDNTAASGELFYGTVVAGLDANIGGSFSAPKVSLLVTLDNESNFSFIVPAGSVPTGEGIYVFQAPGEEAKDPFADTAAAELRGPDPGRFELDTRVEVTDAFRLSIVTNPVTGEELQIRGNGDLTFGITQGGDMSLSGRYTIESGIYELRLFEVIRREFTIAEGSYMDWTGDIMEPTVQLSTVYRLRTSSRELFAALPAGGAPEEEAFGSIPVEVVMELSGPLLTPSVSFDIRTENEYQGTAVETALNRLKMSESETNKQAFSLLVFGSFMTEGPVARDPMAYQLQNQARQSLSNLLTSQLNRFASKYLPGVDLEIGVESYGETGSEEVEARTEVNLGLSKQFLGDRLTVEVGGSVDLEETGEQEVDATGLAGDFSVEYFLTPGGTYRLKAFSTEEVMEEFVGEVTVTGISFIFQKDFTTLKDLFGKGKEKEE